MGDDGDLGQDHGPVDGSGYLFGALNTEADVSIVKSDGNKCLELGPLTSMGLLCTGVLFKTSSLRDAPRKKADALRVFDGPEEETDLLHRLGLHVLDQLTQLGDGGPLLVLGLASMTSHYRALLQHRHHLPFGVFLETKLLHSFQHAQYSVYFSRSF